MSTADPRNSLQARSDFEHAFTRIPSDHYVVWNGRAYTGQEGSIVSRVLAMVETPWKPISLRTLVSMCSQAHSGDVSPDQVRNAIRRHQGASGAAYFLVRRTLEGHWVAVADIPFPSSPARPVRGGEVVLSRVGERTASERSAVTPLRM